MELEYVPIDDEGTPTKDRTPKWRLPQNEWERRVLNALCRKYWPEKGQGGKDVATQFRTIYKSMTSLTTGIVAIYPTEWVDSKIQWVLEENIKRQPKERLTWKALLGAINNIDRKNNFVSMWQRKNVGISLKIGHTGINGEEKRGEVIDL